jgi:hypothetical protein
MYKRRRPVDGDDDENSRLRKFLKSDQAPAYAVKDSEGNWFVDEEDLPGGLPREQLIKEAFEHHEAKNNSKYTTRAPKKKAAPKPKKEPSEPKPKKKAPKKLPKPSAKKKVVKEKEEPKPKKPRVNKSKIQTRYYTIHGASMNFITNEGTPVDPAEFKPFNKELYENGKKMRWSKKTFSTIAKGFVDNPQISEGAVEVLMKIRDPLHLLTALQVMVAMREKRLMKHHLTAAARIISSILE